MITLFKGITYAQYTKALLSGGFRQLKNAQLSYTIKDFESKVSAGADLPWNVDAMATADLAVNNATDPDTLAAAEEELEQLKQSLRFNESAAKTWVEFDQAAFDAQTKPISLAEWIEQQGGEVSTTSGSKMVLPDDADVSVYLENGYIVIDDDKTEQPETKGALVSDYFSDKANENWQLQVRNTKDKDVKWKAVITDVPYERIVNVSGAKISLETTKSDGGYTHTLIGKEALGAYSNITIKADVSKPSGKGTGLVLSVLA